MVQAEIQNLHFATGQQAVDDLNSEFYGKIQFPWPPQFFERVQQPDLAPRMLAQDLGVWRGGVLPEEPRIWVAGCGTNQALFTALRFHRGRVLGSDLSAESLAACGDNAASLGVGNLELVRESINEASYDRRFDYVLCTGVIHHNADPAAPLSRLAAALEPAGVLELMVYNHFHRVLTSAFQNAIWILLGRPAKPDLASELPVARELVRTFRRGNLMSTLLEGVDELPEAGFADYLLQPVEHSFTVESLVRMARGCGLELLSFCNDAFSRVKGDAGWDLDFASPRLRDLYEPLPDADRWQITNLLQAEASPMLWFYFQRQDSPRPRQSERQIADGFAASRFRRVKTQKEIFMRKAAGGYLRRPLVSPFPGEPRHALAHQVHSALDEEMPLGTTLSRLGIEPSLAQLSRLRLALATSGNPYLEAVD